MLKFDRNCPIEIGSSPSEFWAAGRLPLPGRLTSLIKAIMTYPKIFKNQPSLLCDPPEIFYLKQLTSQKSKSLEK